MFLLHFVLKGGKKLPAVSLKGSSLLNTGVLPEEQTNTFTTSLNMSKNKDFSFAKAKTYWERRNKSCNRCLISDSNGQSAEIPGF